MKIRRRAVFLGLILKRECFLPILADSRDAALQNIYALEPDVLIIDLPLSGCSCVELFTELQVRKITKPIIILGDSSEEIDKVLALEAGADDYIGEPFAPRELVARVRAALRRRKVNLDAVTRFGNVEVDRQHRTVTCQGQEVRMTPCELSCCCSFLPT